MAIRRNAWFAGAIGFLGLMAAYRFRSTEDIWSYRQSKVSRESSSLLVSKATNRSRSYTTVEMVDNDKFDDSCDKPIFWIHAGPLKVGTTYLQTALCRHSNMTEPILRQDKIVFLGGCPWTWPLPEQYFPVAMSSFFQGGPDWGMFKLIHHHSSSTDADLMSGDPKLMKQRNKTIASLSPDFIRRVNEQQKLRNHAMVIDENFIGLSDGMAKALADFLNPNWQVKIMIAYRPFYSWLVSLHYSSQRQSIRRDFPWPGIERGKKPVPFTLDEGGEGTGPGVFHNSRVHKDHVVQLSRDLIYSKFFKHVEILPLHRLSSSAKNDAQLEYFFCQFAKDVAPNTCEAVLDGRVGEAAVSNAGVQIMADLVGIEAHDRGLLRPEWDDRPKIRDRIRKRLRKNNMTEYDFPMICPSNDTLQELEDMSLLMEHKLFSDDQQFRQDDELHRRGFESYINKNKFCYVDVGKVMEDPSWLDFFAKL